jgi:hypothetical protein
MIVPAGAIATAKSELGYGERVAKRKVTAFA